MNTLVAAPTCRRKAYAFDEWAAATASYDRLLSVAEDETDYGDELTAQGFRVVVYPIPPGHRPRHMAVYGPLFNAAWRAIVEGAEGYTHILGLDTDVIPDCDILALMKENYTEGFLCHGVPWREGYKRPGYGYETSCTLASVKDWEAALDRCEKERNYYDEPRTLYGMVRDFPHTDILIVELKHIDDGEGRTPKSQAN